VTGKLTRAVVPVPPPQGEERGTQDGPPLFLDVAAMLDGGLPDPPAPVLLRRDDGVAVFYDGQVNQVYGEPESGKTLVTQAAATEALLAGRRVAFLDLDHNGPQSTIRRFLDFGAPEQALRDPGRFRYVEPEDKSHLLAIVEDLSRWRPAVAVVDSIGELLPLLGLSSNSPDDFTTAHADVLKPLAQAGAAVLGVDHLPKNPDSKASGPTGTAAKRRVVGGVSVRVTVKQPFTPGRGGSAYLSISKDRHGGLRRHCPAEGREPSVGLFSIDSSEGRIAWRLRAPEREDLAGIEGADPQDLSALDKLDPAPTSVRDVKNRLGWGSDRANDALAAWRSRNVPEERGTTAFPVPHPGVEERGTHRSTPERVTDEWRIGGTPA
jgi:hypothetical protein